MFQKILLPVDLTDRHEPALQIVAKLAAPGAEVALLHVIELIAGLAVEEEKDFYRRLEKTAQRHIARLRASIESRGLACRPEVRLGNRAAEVVRFASEAGSELIVLTAPSPDPDNPMVGWGSLSFKVGYLSPCPVVLVKG